MDSFNLSIVSKIKLNLEGYSPNYLNLNDESFLIYTPKEIIIVYKNLSFKKIFPSYNDEEAPINYTTSPLWAGFSQFLPQRRS